jgi:DNA mismatch repair protein MutL
VAELERPRLWQVHDTYIIAETRDGLLIIDQHSAHERVLFQRLMEAFRRRRAERAAAPLPLDPSPSARRAPADLGAQGSPGRAGFEVEEFGGDTVIVQSVPNPHPYFDAERCFREMVAGAHPGSPNWCDPPTTSTSGSP